MNVRTVGQLAAAATLAVVVLLLIIAWQHESPSSSLTPGQAPPSVGVAEEGADIRNIIDTGGGTSWQRLNPETGELEYRLEWNELDPREGGNFDVVFPSASIFGSDVRAEISAESGRIRWPSREDRVPESGDLVGDVEITLYDTNSADPETELATIYTPKLSFDSALGELKTVDRVSVEGPGIRFEGRGLILRFSETQRRLQFALIERGELLEVTPSLLADSAAEESGTEIASSEPTQDQVAERLQEYRVLVRGGARLSQGQRSITADEVVAWARLRDGRLASDAVKQITAASSPESASGDSSKTSSDSESADDTIRLVWDGQLEISPLRESPAELAENDLSVVFRSPTKTRPVRLIDEATGASVSSSSAFYAMTRAVLELEPMPLEGVLAAFPGELDATFEGSISADLTAGVARATGPGQLLGAVDPDTNERPRLTWQGNADALLSAEPDQPIRIKRFAAEETVRLVDEGQSAAAEYLALDFITAADETTRPEKLTLQGQVALRGEADESGVMPDIKSDEVVVVFDTSAAEPIPTAATAIGSVFASAAEGDLRADQVNVMFRTDSEGETQPRRVEASGSAYATTAEGVILEGDTIRGEINRETLQLTGSPAKLTTPDGEAKRFVTGENIILTRKSREFIVYGPGTADLTQPSTAADPEAEIYDTVSLTWTRNLFVNDSTGQAEASGNATAIGTFAHKQERHEAKGERLVLRYTPYSEDNPDQPREMVSFAVEGNQYDADNAARSARVESRFLADAYSSESGPSMVALHAAELLSNAEDQTLDVPTPGLLLISDQRALDEPVSEGDPTTQGTSAFTWQGSMQIDRLAGTATMNEAVSVRHLAPPDRDGKRALSRLASDALTATFTRPSDPATPLGESEPPVLETIVAEGGVVLTRAGLEIDADSLTYEESTGIAVASAAEGALVTVYDSEEKQTYNAEVVEINLSTGRWRTRGASGRRSFR